MGLFTSKIKTTITVATQVMRMIPDDQVPNSLQSGTLEALTLDQNLSDTVENKLVDSFGRKAYFLYKEAKKKYFYGLPSGQFLAMNKGDNSVIAKIALEEKVDKSEIVLEYSYYTPLNIYHLAWIELVRDHQYTPSTNKLGKLSTELKQDVYLDDLVLNLEQPTQTIIDPDTGETSYEDTPYLDNITAPWGRPTKSLYSPTRAYAGDSSSYEISSEAEIHIGTIPKIDKATFHVCYAYNQVVDPKSASTLVPGVVTGEFTLAPDMTDIFSKIDPVTGKELNPKYHLDFYQVKYRIKGETKFITRDSTWLPESIFNVTPPSATTGGFFPLFYTRWDKKDQSIDKTTEAYKDTVRILKTVKLDFDYLCEQIHNEDVTEETLVDEEYVDQDPQSKTYKQKLTRKKRQNIKDDNGKNKRQPNEKLKDVSSIFIFMGTSANSTNEVDIEYLHAFFSQWALDPGNKSEAELFLTVGNNRNKNVSRSSFRNFSPVVENYNTIIIQDARFKMSLQNQGITISHRYIPSMPADRKRYTMSYADGVHTYTHFNSDFTAIDIKVKGLKMTYFVGSAASKDHPENTLGYNDVGDGVESHLLIPIDTRISNNYSLAKKEVLYSRGQHLIYNTEIITKTKIPWYTTGMFKIFVIIILIIIIILVAIFAPYLLPTTLGYALVLFNMGLTAAALILVATFILEAIIVMVIMHFVLKAIVKLVGPKAALILAVIVVVVSVGYGISGAVGMIQGIAGATMAPATFLLSVATGLMSAANDEYIHKSLEISKEYEDFLEFTKKKDAELKKATDDLLLDNSIKLEPFVIPGEKPSDYFDRTIHTANPGTACFGMLSSFCDILLTLPTFNESINKPIEE